MDITNCTDTLRLLYELSNALWAISGLMLFLCILQVIQVLLMATYHIKIYIITSKYYDKIIEHLKNDYE